MRVALAGEVVRRFAFLVFYADGARGLNCRWLRCLGVLAATRGARRFAEWVVLQDLGPTARCAGPAARLLQDAVGVPGPGVSRRPKAKTRAGEGLKPFAMASVYTGFRGGADVVRA